MINENQKDSLTKMLEKFPEMLHYTPANTFVDHFTMVNAK